MHNPKIIKVHKRLGGKAQISLEYMVLIIIIVALLIGMGVYVKRQIMGKWKESADSFGFGRQYEPGPGGTRITH